jgi:hypothetical protein
MLLSIASLCALTAVAAQDGGVVSYEGYQLLRVYPSTTQQLRMVTGLVKRRRYEGLVSLWSRQLIAGRTSGNNRTEQSADLLTAPHVLEDLVEQLDGNGISYDVLIHNLEVRKTTTHPWKSILLASVLFRRLTENATIERKKQGAKNICTQENGSNKRTEEIIQ